MDVFPEQEDMKKRDLSFKVKNELSKLISYKDLAQVRSSYKDKKIALCHGAFDLVHLGHLIHFKQARENADILVVTITADEFITKKRSVSFSQEDRANQLCALEVVDFVSIIYEKSAVTAIKYLKPDFYAKGSEYKDLTLDKTKNIFSEKSLVESLGGRLIFTGGQTYSSTKLNHFLQASPEADQSNPLLRNEGVKFKDISYRKIKLETLKELVVQASKLKVCVIGETIIDEWVNVTLNNVSQKSKCVTGLEIGKSTQIGGAGIITLHMSNFVQSVDFYSNHYPVDPPENVRLSPISNSELIKRRYVDRDSGFTLFESKKLDINVFGRNELPNFDNYDLVVIADFGHGLIDEHLVNEMIEKSKKAFICVMAQVNSSNYGFNLPNKYIGAHYYSVNKTEAELCLQKKNVDIDLLVTGLYDHLKPLKGLSVTNGKNGAYVKSENKLVSVESLSEHIVDTIGCGDAYLAFSSLSFALGFDEEIVALAGNIGAAAISQKRCNESPVSESEFMTIAKIVI